MDQPKNKKILANLEKALDFCESGDVEEGFKMMKECERKLELYKESDIDLKLITHHNLAMCYQLMQDFEECAIQLDHTIKIAKNRDSSYDTERIRNTRYLSMLSIQIGAILSHLGDHTQAVFQAKQAFNYASQSFQLCTSLAATTKSLPDACFQNFKTLETTLLYLSGKIGKFPTNCKPIVPRTLLGVLHYTDWIFSFSINDILDIKPLKYFEVKNSHTFVAELSKDFMLEKICLILSSCYLIATETRLLDDINEVKKAKGWHLRAVEIGLGLLPPETPLLQHIRASFNKHYPTVTIKKPPKSKSKTPVKDGRCFSARNKTPMRPKLGMPRKVIKDTEIKTERSFIKERLDTSNTKAQDTAAKCKTQREDNQEPEPPISEDYDQKVDNTFIINSNDLYGVYSEDD
jgi:tetratricopeptide (TPR) repeat protein